MEHLLLSCIESRVENNRNLYGRFQLGPFDRGQGLTIANALRRTLLSELSGLAILCVEIQGVSHEYSNLKGVREPVLDVLLNLKQIVFIGDEKFNQPEIGFLKIQGPAVIKACDLKLPTFIQCVDPDQYIATLSDNGVLEMKFMICKGKNFLVETSVELFQKHFQSHFSTKKESQGNLSWQENSVEQFLDNSFQKNKFQENFKNMHSNMNITGIKTLFTQNQIDFQKFEKDLIFNKKKIIELQTIHNLVAKQDRKKKTNTNVLFIDAIFMPIKKVNFSIQNINNYSKIKESSLLSKFQRNYSQEKIILEVWTNGSVHPRYAIHQAAQKIIDLLIPFQKKYLYKKTKLIGKSITSNKPFYSVSNPTKKNQVINDLKFGNTDLILNTFKTEFSTEKNKNANFTSTLNKIYRPWLTFVKSTNLNNYFSKKQKKNIGYTHLVYADKKIKLNKPILYLSKQENNQLESIDIVHLNLSTKSYICLKRANINTIKNLLSYSHNELLLIKNLGKKSVQHIESVVAKMNFKLRNEI